ncbi:unnamed protein product [Ambrosiozyma monospora]|uniref:Unnamed protein product n=1 Tax=Ambrosiozyma monospora TaxID=43982 RepID=A0ACB5T5X1_AMBMO|nr:unnamed protein product [Ambrosiozyma monospora]
MDLIAQYRKKFSYDSPLQHLDYPLYSTHLVPYLKNNHIVTQDTHLESIKVLLFGVTLYHTIFLFGGIILRLTNNFQNKLKKKKAQTDFCIRCVSFIQSILIVTISIPCLQNEHLAKDHIYATTPYSSFVAAMALSYFIWDTLVSLFYVGYFGVGFLVHGIVSTIVFTIGVFHPYIHYYCPIFLLFEISTPFLNVRWIGLKFDVLSELFKLVNNAILMLIFFFVRICWGWL